MKYFFVVLFVIFISSCAKNTEVKRMLELAEGYTQKDFLDQECATEDIRYRCVYRLTATRLGMKAKHSYLIVDEQSNLYLIDKFDYTRKKYFGKYYVNKYGDLAIKVETGGFSPIMYLSIHDKYVGFDRYSFVGDMGKTRFSLTKAMPPASFIQKKKNELQKKEKLRQIKREQERIRKEQERLKRIEKIRKERIRKNPCGLTMYDYASAQAKCRLDAQMYGSNYSKCYKKEVRKLLRKQGCKI